MTCAVVIPARMASTRFPGKPLADLCGKPMVQWVYEACLQADLGEVVVAAPDQEIIDACRRFGARAILTRPDHPSGTDRLAEAAEILPADVYVNVQGDEPLIAPATIRACAAPLLADPSVQMGSVYAPCRPDDEENPNVVKVVLDGQGDALYFSRCPIPYARGARLAPLLRHYGLYAFRREVLMAFSQWQPGALEQTEALEQLRFLEHGVKIRMSLGEESPIGVDTPDQAEQARALLQNREGSGAVGS